MKNLINKVRYSTSHIKRLSFIMTMACSLFSLSLFANVEAENEYADIELQLNASYETCDGSCDGNVSVNASGGVGSFTYLWNTGDDFVVVDDACAGLYTVTVTDEEGTTAVGSIELELSPEGIWLMTSSTDPTCEGASNGTAHVSIMTGVAPYDIVWSDGQMGEDITGLSAGTYTVSVTDVNGCSNTAEVTIEPGTGSITLNLNASYETCVGSCDGNVSVNASGGSGSYTYLWNTGETFVVEDDACAGIYTVTVTDSEGCSAVGSIELELSPEGIWLMTSSTDPTCSGASNGTAHVSIMTGVAPYTIEWSDGQMGEDITGLAAGTYTVTVTDANGCSNTADVTINEGTGSLDLDMNASYETCDGSCDGNVSVNASGGSGSYTYLWNTGGTFVVEDDACAGTYTVTVTDSEGCSAVGSVDLVLSPEGVWLMTTHTDVTCNGDNDGTAHVSVMAGEAPYTIVWSDGQTGEDATGLSAGTYTVTATDANGCSNSEEVVINEPSAIEIIVNFVSDTDCDEDNGSINIGVLGGNSPYTYLWSNGAVTQDIENLGVGTYTVTVTDEDNCTAVGNPITISASDITIDVESTNTQCGANNGSIDITVSGGDAPYTYEWSNGATTEDLENLGTGDYSVTVTDANGCSGLAGPITISESSTIDITIDGTTNTTCGLENGSVSISVSGGIAPYTYEWSNGASTEDLMNVGAGDYSVTVTDAANCTALAGPITVEDSSAPVITVEEVTDATCGLDNGSINISVSGGTAPYIYEWSNGANTQDITDIGAGDYSVTVTDAAGCTAVEGPITVENTASPTITIDDVTNAECGLDNGSINISVNGGTTPYIFEWSNGATTENLTALSAGDYSVTVTDAAGCTAVAGPITVEESSTVAIMVDDVVNASCGLDNGSINISVSGGTAPYTFAWSNSATTENLSNLGAGNYSVTVTDAAGCTAVAGPITVGQSPSPMITVEEVVNADCDVNNGSIDISVNSGTAPYTFIWSNGASTEDIDNLAPGGYFVTVTDDNGCTAAIGPVTVEEEICCEPPIVASVVVIEATCGDSNGIAIIQMVGNNTDFTYDWSPNIGTPNTVGNSRTDLPTGFYTVTIIGDPNCPITTSFTVGIVGGPLATVVNMTPATCDQSNGSVEMSNQNYTYQWCNGATVFNPMDLPAGDCEVTITDPATGCVDTRTVTIGEINPLMIDITINNLPDCGVANGAATVAVTGGGPTYTYLWSNGATTSMISGVPSGGYCVTATDIVSGCVIDTCFVLNDSVIGGAVVIITEPVTTTCVGSSDATVVYDIIYDPAFVQPPSVVIKDAVTGDTVVNGSLSSGTYCIYVTDGNGCLAGNGCFDVLSPPQIDVDIAINNMCDPTPGIEIVETLGGTPPYVYDWCDLPGTDNPQDRPDLETGTYCVTITDANGCTVAADDLMVIDTCACPPMIINSVVVIETDCDTTLGQATVTVVDADLLNLQYEWSIAGFNGPSITGVGAGNYSVVITNLDQPTCSITEEFSIGTINGPETTHEVSPTACGSNVGEVEFSNPAYNYEWFDGPFPAIRSGLSAGTYFVTITDPTDTLNCIDVKTVVIEEAPSFSVAHTINILPDCGASNGSVTVTPSVAGNYTYSWGNFSTVDNLSSGVYEVTVTNNDNGCTASTSFVLINMVADAMLSVEGESFISCPGVNDGTINYTISGAGIYTVQIMDLDSNLQVNGSLAPGIYCVIVTDDAQCIAGGDCVEVKSPDQLDVDVAIYDELCGEPGEIQLVEVLGGTSPYTYLWSNGTTDSIATNLVADTYSFTVTDANNCSVMETVNLNEDPNFPLANISGDNTICGSPTTLCVTSDDNVVWTDSMGLTIATTECVDIAAIGMYFVEVSNEFCSVTDSIEVSPDMFEVEIPDTMVCFGTSTMLNTNGNPNFDYQWSPADVLDDASAPNPIATTDVTTTFIVTVTDGVCEDIVSVLYEVVDNVSLSIVSDDGTVFCSDDSVTLTANGNGVNYSWYDDADLQNLIETGAVLDDANPGAFDEPNTYYVVSELDGCSNVDSITLSNQGFDVEIAADPGIVCAGDTIPLVLTTFTSGDPVDLVGATYTWFGPGIIDPLVEDVQIVVQPGLANYSVEIETEFCSTSSEELSVFAPDFSIANATANPDTIFLSETSQLNVTGNDEWSYVWAPDVSFIDPTDIADPMVQPEETTRYTVTVSGDGCVDVRTVTVTVVQPSCEEPFIFFPNAFSPNGDGFNDVLYLRGQNVTEVFFAIYDRWGEKVFESNDQSIGWDGTFKGKKLSSEVYGFYLRVRCGNGEEFYKQGNVTLFR